ncbi:hypothetical protein VUR80DRAFT_6392 [Thermomyces stellatus]
MLLDVFSGSPVPSSSPAPSILALEHSYAAPAPLTCGCCGRSLSLPLRGSERNFIHDGIGDADVFFFWNTSSFPVCAALPLICSKGLGRVKRRGLATNPSSIPTFSDSLSRDCVKSKHSLSQPNQGNRAKVRCSPRDATVVDVGQLLKLPESAIPCRIIRFLASAGVGPTTHATEHRNKQGPGSRPWPCPDFHAWHRDAPRCQIHQPDVGGGPGTWVGCDNVLLPIDSHSVARRRIILVPIWDLLA